MKKEKIKDDKPLCHCEAKAKQSQKTRFLAEFTLSKKARFFASLRMTREGLGMTGIVEGNRV